MPLGFRGNLSSWCWSFSGPRMTSNSPATPTLPQRVSAMPRIPCSSAGKDFSLTSSSAVVAGDSDCFWKPELTPAEIAACKEAFDAINWKLETPESIYREFSSLRLSSLPKRELIGKFKAAASNACYNKDRYSDVLPFDETRVILRKTKESDSDYINANFVESPAFGHSFIATQGPLKTTIADFWEMVMQQRCPAIIMLTSLVHGSLDKCAPYFPPAANEQQVYGRLRVTNKGLGHSSHSITKRVFEVQPVELTQEPPLCVLHLEYLHWPDHGVPAYTRPIRELYRCISTIPDDAGPIVVHCSAGIGRSGAYIGIDQTLRRILKGDLTAVNLQDTVMRLRDHRYGMVQTKAQYHFIYAAVLDELQDLIQTGDCESSAQTEQCLKK
ncbi:protein-tyrosine-phosphatase PTP1 [Selaginella moellendorffii]|nr:protein-tyrosine-phosphatase PTP1 [Selaginella moellendorffii]|eukprot:XP_002966338.2 protein-tyrosine-phosphatase PTP1 [Selaginella moellendorffii]